mgnify:CR=1 FL=1
MNIKKLMSLLISGVLIINYGSCSNLLAAPPHTTTTQSRFYSEYYNKVLGRTIDIQNSDRKKKEVKASEFLEYLKNMKYYRDYQLDSDRAINIINALFWEGDSDVDMIADTLDKLQYENIALKDFYLDISEPRFVKLLSNVLRVSENQGLNIVSYKYRDENNRSLNYTQKILEKGYECIQELCKNNCVKFKELPTDLKLCALNIISYHPDTYGKEFKKVTSQSAIAEAIEGIYGIDAYIGKKTKAKFYYWKIFDKLPYQTIYEKNTFITWLCDSIVNYYNQNDAKFMELVRDLIDCFEGKYDEMVKCCWYDSSRSETISHILSKTMLSEAGRAGLQGVQLPIAESLLKVGFNNDYQKALATRAGANAVLIMSTLHNEKKTRINAIFEILKSYAPNGTLYQQCREACSKRQHDLVYYLLLNGGVNLTTQDHKDILTLLMEYSKRSSMFGYREKFVLLLESVKCNGFTFEERLSWFTRANDMLPTVGRSDKNKGLLYSSGKHLFDDLRSHTSKSSEQQNDLIKKLKILKPKN